MSILREEGLMRPVKFYDVGMKCIVFSEFPPDCDQYEGPHSKKCYENIWLKTGCLSRGLGWPDGLTLGEITFLNDFDLK